MLPDCFRPSRNWRLNPLLLADEQFTHHISSQTSFFLEINTSPEISHSTLWETLKAYLRGQIIQYSSRAKKLRESKLNDISRSIAEIDNQYSSSPSLSIFKERLRLQTEYNLLSTDKATYLLTKAQFNVHDSGDNVSKLLAQQARQTLSSRLILKIRSEIGELITNHVEINNVFKKYYSNLYTSECDGDPSQLQTFFDKLTLPSVSGEQNNLLGSEISNAEILQAINSLKCNKTPGPDRYTSEFYKKFALELCPLLRAVLNESQVISHHPCVRLR